MCQNFWQESWKAVNRDRIAEYGKAISPAPDKIIGILQNYHAVNADGDFVYTGGKWTGMVFHPYSREEIMQIIPPSVRREIMEDGDGFLAVLYHGNPDR